MEEGNLAILVDAKTEYTKQLINILKLNIYLTIKNIFLEAKKNCAEKNTEELVLKVFQDELSNIPNWNQDIIDKEYNNIVEVSKCDWLEELITAVFVSHTRILTSINFSKNKNKINLKIPKTSHFIHKCFIDVARHFWKNLYLFDDKLNNYELQKNKRECETIIEMSINETIRKELPVKHILKEYLGEDYKENSNMFDEELSTSNNYNLRNMVMKDIQNCSNDKLNQLKLILNNAISEEPQVVEPQVVEPQVVEPQVVEPQVVEPQVVEPQVVEPQVVEPQVVEPQVVEPQVVEPQVVEPQVVEPQVVEPQVVEPQVVEPQVVEPQVVEPQVVEPQVEEQNLDTLINSDLKLDELNLEDMNDLTNYEEVYLDSIINKSNTLEQNKEDLQQVKTISLDTNKPEIEEQKTEDTQKIKTISIDTNKQKKDNNIKDNIINKYTTKKSSEYSFFSNE